MTLKEMMDLEYSEWKKRMVAETGGTYVLLYLMLGFTVLLNAIWGSGVSLKEFFYISLGVVIIYDVFSSFLFRINENGVRVNIFNKYLYSPISIGSLIRTKILVQIKVLALPIILGQLAAVVLCIADPDNLGTSLRDIAVWMPGISSTVYILYSYAKCEAWRIFHKTA